MRPKSRGGLRVGTSSMEYVGVCATMCIVVASAVGVLGESIASLNSVSNSIAVSKADSAAIAETSAYSAAYATKQLTPRQVSHLQIFSALSAVCLVALGILYLSRANQRPVEEEPATCSVAQIQRNSKALQAVLDKRTSVKSLLIGDFVHLFEDNAQVGTYMSRSVATVRPDMTIEDADRMLREDGFRRVMVTHTDGRMAGVLSRKDIASKQGKLVADIMTDAPKTASPDMNVRVALSILLQNRISCLPVVKDDVLVGLISTSDFLIVLQCILLILGRQNQKDLGTSSEQRDAVV